VLCVIGPRVNESNNGLNSEKRRSYYYYHFYTPLIIFIKFNFNLDFIILFVGILLLYAIDLGVVSLFADSSFTFSVKLISDIFYQFEGIISFVFVINSTYTANGGKVKGCCSLPLLYAQHPLGRNSNTSHLMIEIAM